MSPTLRVPVEIIERILYYALGGDQPIPTPDTSFGPSAQASAHLLRVSKGMTELALPHYWRSLVIVRSNEWSTLFHVRDGLLVGDDNADKRSWVKQLSMSVQEDARVPHDVEACESMLASWKDPLPLNHESFVPLSRSIILGSLQHLCYYQPQNGTPFSRVQSDRREVAALRVAADCQARLTGQADVRWSGRDPRHQAVNNLHRSMNGARRTFFQALLDGSPIKSIHVSVHHGAGVQFAIKPKQDGPISTLCMYRPSEQIAGGSRGTRSYYMAPYAAGELGRYRRPATFAGFTGKANLEFRTELERRLIGRTSLDRQLARELWAWIEEDGSATPFELLPAHA